MPSDADLDPSHLSKHDRAVIWKNTVQMAWRKVDEYLVRRPPAECSRALASGSFLASLQFPSFEQDDPFKRSMIRQISVMKRGDHHKAVDPFLLRC